MNISEDLLRDVFFRSKSFLSEGTTKSKELLEKQTYQVVRWF